MKQRARLIGVILFVSLGVFSLGARETGTEHVLARLVLKNNFNEMAGQMRTVHAMNLDVAGVNLRDHTVDLVLSGAQFEQMRKNGAQFSYVRTLASRATPSAEYQTPEKIGKTLQAFQAQYPNLAKVFSIGKSLEGRDIFVIKITSNVNTNDASKSRIFFNGMHHAREVMSNEVPLDTIQTLLSGYGRDQRITHWVDTNEIWVLPMFNVDGNNKVWTNDNMWRKNTRGGYGVDINRNYPYAWNSCRGSSGSQGAQDYHGPSAASEPETNVMMNFVKQIRPTFSISYHSYSEIVMYPYGCANARTETKEVVETIGKEVASLMVTDDKKSHYVAGTAPELLYSVDGGDIDWFYHEANVIPFVIEVNSSNQGFQPDYKVWRDQTVARVRPGWQLLLNKMDGSSIKGRVTDQAGKGLDTAVLHIKRTSAGAPFAQDFPVRAGGFFHVILPMGQFQVTFQAPGLAPQVQSVNVGQARVDLNSVLSKVRR